MSKRALIVGINEFTRESWALNGCVNDAAEMECLLKLFYGFKDPGIRVLRDRDATKAGIMEGLGWLLSDYDGDGSDVRVFHFASHGTQVDDQNGDEWECLDEVIVPHDHDWDAPLRDDDLWEFFKDVPENVNFTFIADCCHSGTIQRAAKEIVFHPRFLARPVDVEERVKRLRKARDDKLKAYQAAKMAELLQGVPPDQLADKIKSLLESTEAQFKEEQYGVVSFQRHFLLAASESEQTAADAVIGDEWRGAMTWGVGKAIKESNGDLTYEQLIARTGVNLKDYDQRPQLECPADLRNHKVFAPLG